MRVRIGMCVGIVGILLLASGVASQAGDRAVIATTDFSSATLAIVDLETIQVTTNLLNIHSDAVIRVHNGIVYVINRLGQDNISVVDPDNPQEVLIQYSVGNGTNPQDIAFVSDDRAYVARLGSPRLLIVNPATGDSLGSVDLGFAADADGLPEAAHLAIIGNQLYVTCQRLAGFAPSAYSTIIVINTDTDAPVDLDEEAEGIQGIQLAATNPFAQVRVGDKLILSNSGAFGETDGGLEVVDLSTRQTLGVQLSESELGGGIGALAMVDGSAGYVVVSAATNRLVSFNLDTDDLPVELVDISGGYIPDIQVLKDRLYVSDQGLQGPGLRVFDVGTNELVAGPISTGLPPASIGFLTDTARLSTDYDESGRVDFADFLLFVAGFGSRAGEVTYEARFDLDLDERVDFSDFLIFVEDFGKIIG